MTLLPWTGSALTTMFPRIGSQILIEPGSPEDFHVMEVKNVSRDASNVGGFEKIARSKLLFLKIC